ncbi:DUF4865 family protein [Streptomyces nitrosporeus]|uniref:DUF4865 family protein n=1 Tax=Streptomyces nitrosporeus TaxID=28894 RepID=A0A5J6FJD0_9ACTN|nr:DUF4865 family protein [Streptomyces nitrosporeus]QEU75937.1 DUF4865 family protein [Streptomyces nitrosporeus]GGY89584.1 DUF4865 domain-containing protein [Streptomyces nitrosporeus]
MHAMQYGITLPADYDMGIIRERVATRGHLLDGFPGLGLKAYLMRERGEGSAVNQYAPLYLWAAPEGMNDFLLGPGFQGVVNDFGRPRVRHWAGLDYTEGPAAGSAPRTAVRHLSRLPEETGPAAPAGAALEEHRRLAACAGVVAAAVALDPHRWELLHFTLWADGPADVPGDRFEVLHLSAPERARLAKGAGA